MISHVEKVFKAHWARILWIFSTVFFVGFQVDITAQICWKETLKVPVFIQIPVLMTNTKKKTLERDC